MLKSCKYCGRVHDSRYICPQKEQDTRKRWSHRKNEKVAVFHHGADWKRKSLQIRTRDSFCCQLCIRGIGNPEREYETDGLSVHHIDSVEDSWEERMEDENLITLCRRHHEDAESGKIPKKLLRSIAREQETSPR